MHGPTEPGATPCDRRPARARAVFYFGLLAVLAAHLLLDIRSRDGFTWMDPEQYYEAASHLALGGGFKDFAVASFYPLLLGAFLFVHDSIPWALGVHALWLAGLGIAFVLICRRRDLGEWAPAGLLVLMAGPAMFGLSRELYIEFPLTALVTLHYLAWLREGEKRNAFRLGLLMAAGFAIKMTYPLFILGPILADAATARRRRNPRRLLWLAGIVVIPVLSVIAIAFLYFPGMFEYYSSIGNTRIPTMRLIGPPEAMSWAAAWFYPHQIAKSYLGWAGLPILVLLAMARPFHHGRWDRERLGLWLGVLIPVGVFAWMPVREVRHLAPAIPALVLLAGHGFRDLVPLRQRARIGAAACLLAAVPYLAVTAGRVEAPYFLNRPMRLDQVSGALFSMTPDAARYWTRPDRPDVDRWRFTRSLLLSGFDPNEALAFAWSLAPGGTIDLDRHGQRPAALLPNGYQAFMDFFLLAAFNLYNRRCGWNHAYETLTREEALDAADALVLMASKGEEPPRFEGFSPVDRVERYGGSAYVIYRPDRLPRKTFRRIYAEKYLARNPGASREELNAVWTDMRLEAVLRNGKADEEAMRALFPADFVLGGKVQPIYFLSAYPELMKVLSDSPDSPPSP
ncbi:MAG: hypothetical protein KA248_10950 [Kiritimatiellae bacterium]|nr:hypothetical protein [Kiritimatiellia bacterium]